MKTDLVLTMGEYLAMCCDVPKQVNPPGKDARHIPITAEGDVETKNVGHGCRCDRWGHLCPSFTEYKQEQCAPVQDFGNKESR
jgi:hypothetical protein